MANSLFDIYLGDISSIQGYRCRSLVRDSAPLVAARFSTGQPSQTDLDLLKVNSVDSLAGGMFQRFQSDPTLVARSFGFFNPYDENFYPTLPSTSDSTNFGIGYFNCKAEGQDYSFYCTQYTSAGSSYNTMTKVSGGVATAITMPAALFGAAGSKAIGGICIHKGYVFVAGAREGLTSVTAYRYNIVSGGALTSIGGTACLFFTLRGLLYAVGTDAVVYAVTNETTGTATYTALSALVGSSDHLPKEWAEFNGTTYLSKVDGLYRFDGVTCVRVLNYYAQKLTVWNGALYFIANKWLYRFDGTTVQKLQYFTEGVENMSISDDYLFIQSWVVTSTIDIDKFHSSSGYVRIYTYDGIGFNIIYENVIAQENSKSDGLVANSGHVTFIQSLAGPTAYDNIAVRDIDLSNIFSSSAVTSSSVLDITSSEDDAGFPNIYKSLEAIDVNYSDIVNGDIITVKYQLYDGRSWGSWQTLGTISYSSTLNNLEVTDNSNKLYKKIKVNVYASTLTAGSTLKIKGFAWRYTLQPRLRWRWQAQLMTEGNSDIKDRAGSFITDDSNALTNTVIKASKQKTPIFMFSPDYGIVKTQITNSALSFIIKGQVAIYTDPYNEYPLIAVKNHSGVWEILRVSSVSYSGGSDETTITVLERGYYGVTAAQIDADAEFHLAYKVYVTRVLRDAPILDDSTYTEQSTGESQLKREFLLELTEV